MREGGGVSSQRGRYFRSTRAWQAKITFPPLVLPSPCSPLPSSLLPSRPGSFVECCLNALAVVGVIAFRLPILLVGLLPLLLVAGAVARLYLTSSREMKRLESNR